MKKKKAIIIGSGIAGISAAVKLAQNFIEVEIYEARNFPGGRIYSFPEKITGETIDNGQHILMGAYENFLSLMNELGTKNKIMTMQGIRVPYIYPDERTALFSTGITPGRFGMLFGLFNLKPLSFFEKISAFDFLISLTFKKRHIHKTVAEILADYHQSKNTIQLFWEPLCLAVMNLKPAEADAGIFCEVLRRAFFNKAENARLIFPANGLSEMFKPFEEYLKKNGGKVIYSSRVDEILTNGKNVLGIKVDGEIKTADYFISTIQPYALKKILPEKIDIGFDPAKFSYSTIISCYLWYDRDFLTEWLYSLIGMNIQWVFNRRKIFRSESRFIKQNPGHLAITISGAEAYDSMSNNEILEMCLADLGKAFPQSRSAKLNHSKVIRDKFATFKASPGAIQKRPGTKTPLNNFFLAGDWTDTGLPATIEGACQSGFRAAEEIILSDSN